MKRKLCFILSLMLALCVCFSANAETNAEQYENAIGLLKEDNYTEAGKAFAALGSYADSPRYVMYCSAIVVGEAGNYTTAVSNLTNLGDFLDSSLLATYYAGLSWESTEDYEKALEMLAGISLYRDVSERIATYPGKILERDYKKADENEQAGRLEAALSGFKELGDYKDSANRAKVIQEKIKERDEAAAEKARENAYAAADKAEQDGDYATAYDGFVNLGDYKDSKDRAAVVQQRAKYAKGLQAIENMKYQDAYEIFNDLGDFEDSAEKAYLLGISTFSSFSQAETGVATFKFHDNIGLVNFNKNITIPPQWSKIGTFHDGLAYAIKNERYGVVDMEGKVITDYQWSAVADYKDGFTIVKKNDSKRSKGWNSYYLYGLMDTNGNIVGNFWSVMGSNKDNDYYGIYSASFIDDRIRIGKVDEETYKYGYMDSKGNVIVEPQYDSEMDFSNGLAAVEKAGKWGFIDLEGSVVIPIKYDQVTSFTREGLADVCLNDEWQIIDKEGTLIYFKSFGDDGQIETSNDEAKEPIEEVLSNEYEGTALGFGGMVVAHVTIEDGVIKALEFDAPYETEFVGQAAVKDEEFIEQFIGKKLPLTIKEDVDIVTGATFSSTAAIEAVNNAYSGK